MAKGYVFLLVSKSIFSFKICVFYILFLIFYFSKALMVIFLYGPDTYRSRQKLAALKNGFHQKKDSTGLGLINLDGANLTVDQFRAGVLSLALFSQKRMIIIENLLAKNRNRELIQEIKNFLGRSNQDQDNVVVFWEETFETNEINRDLVSQLKMGKYSQEFPLLKEAEIIDWLKKEVAKRNGKIDLTAIQTLINYVGADLWQLNNELNKLLAYTQTGRGIITRREVEMLVKPKIDENIFNLTEAIGVKNKKLALKLFNDQIEKGVPFEYLLTMIAWQYRNLLLIKDFLGDKKRLSPKILAQKLKLHPFVCQKALNQINKYTITELKKIYKQLLAVDLKIKTTRINPEVLFDLLIANQH